MITKIYFRFELMPPKDAELNFRGGPWEKFSLTSSFKADKGEFELSGCGKPNRIVTVKCWAIFSNIFHFRITKI